MLEEIKLEGGRSNVVRKGNMVLREIGPWGPSVHAILKHLEEAGFSGAPTVLGSGFDEKGREILSYIEGDLIHPAPWNDNAIIATGQLLKKLHDATANFKEPENAQWHKWFGRDLGGTKKVIGHCDFAPWNLVSKNRIPFAAIDWENAGPVDPLIELAQVCWLNVQLCDDDVGTRVGLPSVEKRAQQLRLLTDAYGLSKNSRGEFFQALSDFVVCDAADQAVEANITMETTNPDALWGLAWRTRSAAWIVKNRKILENALS